MCQLPIYCVHPLTFAHIHSFFIYLHTENVYGPTKGT